MSLDLAGQIQLLLLDRVQDGHVTARGPDYDDDGRPVHGLAITGLRGLAEAGCFTFGEPEPPDRAQRVSLSAAGRHRYSALGEQAESDGQPAARRPRTTARWRVTSSASASPTPPDPRPAAA